MKADELIEALNGILKPGSYDPDNDDDCDWVENTEIGYASIAPRIQAQITKALGEWNYELTCFRPYGQEDTQRTVLYFKEHNVYLAFDGYYDSWNGGNFDDAEFYEVKPVEKTYTDWVAVK